MSAAQVYGGGSTPSPLPPLGEHPLAPPSASPGSGPGTPTMQPPPSSSLSGDGGALPVTGYGVAMLLAVALALAIIGLLFVIGARSNRPGDR